MLKLIGAHLDGGEAVVVLADLEQGDVEGAAAQVEDEDELVLLALVQAVGQGRGGGLVDDAVHGQSGDGAGLLGGLAFGIGELGGDGDHGVGDGLTEVGLTNKAIKKPMTSKSGVETWPNWEYTERISK